MALYQNVDLKVAGAYQRLGAIGLEIVRNASKGFDQSKKQKDLKARLIKSTKLVRSLLNHTAYNTNGDFVEVRRVEDNEYNKVLRALIRIAEVQEFPVAPKIGYAGYPYLRVAGSAGPQGGDGEDAYVYIGYAEDASGTGFSTTPDPARKYIAFKNSNVPLAVVVGIFSGLWGKYLGENGAAGATGAAGQSQYVFIGWADDASGTGFTLTFNASKPYVAFLVKNNATPPVVGDYAGLWARYLGTNGTNGTDGNTVLFGAGVPSNGLGVDGNFYIDINTPKTLYGPKTGGTWGAGASLVGATGPAGATGANGADGANAFLYIAYADDAAGTGFTTTFDPNKDYIALKQTTALLGSPAVGDFAGLWAKYRGDGDRWSTNSNTSTSIATGIKVFVVETNLAFSTGQRVVISVPADSANRMEGICEGYDPIAGQLTVDVDTIYGSGTYASWDVSLQGAPISIASKEGYYGSMATDQGSGGTGQSISTTPTKITQWDTKLAESAGMTVDPTTNNRITVANRGAYYVSAFGSVSSGASAALWTIQIYKNGNPVANMISTLEIAANDTKNFSLGATLESVDADDYFEVFATEAAGSQTFLLEQGQFDVHTIGAPNTSQFKKFENADVDTGTEIVDSFSASLGYYAVWEVRIRKSNNIRGIRVSAIWDGSNQPNFTQETPNDLGTIDVTLSCDFNAGDIRLKATATTNDWNVAGIRTLVA